MSVNTNPKFLLIRHVQINAWYLKKLVLHYLCTHLIYYSRIHVYYQVYNTTIAHATLHLHCNWVVPEDQLFWVTIRAAEKDRLLFNTDFVCWDFIGKYCNTVYAGKLTNYFDWLYDLYAVIIIHHDLGKLDMKNTLNGILIRCLDCLKLVLMPINRAGISVVRLVILLLLTCWIALLRIMVLIGVAGSVLLVCMLSIKLNEFVVQFLTSVSNYIWTDALKS